MPHRKVPSTSMFGSNHRRTPGLFFLIGLLASSAVALDPYASVTSPDGTIYSFYRTGEPVTTAKASAACIDAGGQLASLTSADQVLSSLWSSQVVGAAAENEDTTLLWTGLKISWAGSNNRRMLRADGVRSEMVSSSNPDDDDGQRLLERLIKDMEDSGEPVPATTSDGRRLPQLVRAWSFQQRRSQRRALLGGGGTGEGNESPYLNNAVLSWADGSGPDFVLSNPSNMGFLACNRKKLSECCGAVFDIGPDPYPGSEFPSIFFYPCGSEKIVGAMAPTGFACTSSSLPVAELPKPGTATPGKAPATTETVSCSPGSMPATKHGRHSCVRCKANSYSADGVKCRKCAAGKKSGKGAVVCH